MTQALLAIIILEDVNYIEHYGLQRALTRTGRQVKSHHSEYFTSSSQTIQEAGTDLYVVGVRKGRVQD